MQHEEILSREDALKLYEASARRRDEIIRAVNKKIKEGASNGENLIHFPNGLTVNEEDWLANNLSLYGYLVSYTSKTFQLK